MNFGDDLLTHEEVKEQNEVEYQGEGHGQDSEGEHADHGGVGEVEEDNEVIDSDEEMVRPPKKMRLKDRLVHDLDSALDEANYDPYEEPENIEELIVVLKKTGWNQPDVVMKRVNKKTRPRVGRRPASMIHNQKAGTVLGAD